MGSVEYLCVCGWRGDTKPEDWRCPRCGDLVGWAANETEELQPGQRAEWVFGRWQRRQGLAAIVETAFRFPIQNKRWNARKRAFRAALREYAESSGISTKDDDWYDQARSLLGQDMFSLVLPMMPRIKLDGMDIDEASLQEWAHTLRRLMNREATEELIGTAQEKNPPAARRVTKAEEIILLALEIEFARRSGRLNEDDDRAIEAFKATGGNYREAAKALGWTEARFRKRMQRIREKLA
jgi:hypothetical protein